MGVSINFGLPLLIIHFDGIFPNKNHPAIGAGPILGPPQLQCRDRSQIYCPDRPNCASKAAGDVPEKNERNHRESIGKAWEYMEVST